MLLLLDSIHLHFLFCASKISTCLRGNHCTTSHVHCCAPHATRDTVMHNVAYTLRCKCRGHTRQAHFVHIQTRKHILAPQRDVSITISIAHAWAPRSDMSGHWHTRGRDLILFGLLHHVLALCWKFACVSLLAYQAWQSSTGGRVRTLHFAVHWDTF